MSAHDIMRYTARTALKSTLYMMMLCCAPYSATPRLPRSAVVAMLRTTTDVITPSPHTHINDVKNATRSYYHY